MHRLAGDRWQTRQNPRTFPHGGRELRWLRLIRPEQPNHTRIQRLMSLPSAPSRDPVNFSGYTFDLRWAPTWELGKRQNEIEGIRVCQPRGFFRRPPNGHQDNVAGL